MKDVNKVILVGRLGADPVLRTTKSGSPIANFPIATSRRRRDGEDGQLTESTQWHRVVAWGKQGEHCAQYLKKGSSVYIEGTFRSRKYENPEGLERVAFEVHADRVSFLGRTLGKAEEVSSAEPELGAVAG